MKKSIYEALQQDFRDLVLQGKLTLENKPKWHDLACCVYLKISSEEEEREEDESLSSLLLLLLPLEVKGFLI